MPLSRWLLAWSAAAAILLLRWTCRIRLHNDPRPQLRASGTPYIYSVLHAHQIAAIIDGERGTGAMVSRSVDGGVIVPALWARGIRPIRGSGMRGGASKGGRAALDALIEHVRGGAPAYLAVDGPRGPRGHVHKGIALMSQKTGAAVVIVVPVPTRRWIIRRSWDRMQVPKPLSRIDAHFGQPLYPQAGEPLESYRQRIEQAILVLERQVDPGQAGPARRTGDLTLATAEPAPPAPAPAAPPMAVAL